MAIEAARQSILDLPMDMVMLRSLHESAKLLSTHYSTQIEGNRLTQAEVEEVISGGRFPGRERDEKEVKNYYKAMEEVERLAQERQPLTEEIVQRIHGLAFGGKAKPTDYRDGQNVIRDSTSGRIVYMPPESNDVPALMSDLADWINISLDVNEIPAPLIAGLAHCQFATIHPYYDGNGRTARLLTTLILHSSGYGLKGIYSLEEYYARDLSSYYTALEIGESHNYYMGRVEADVTKFLEYFCHGMAHTFTSVRTQGIRARKRKAQDESQQIRLLSPRERHLLVLFQKQQTVTTKEIAEHLGLSPRTVTSLCRDWVKNGLLQFHDPSKKNRAYKLGDIIVER
jgi:cell filamentation protein, protein adenylyltransferase